MNWRNFYTNKYLPTLEKVEVLRKTDCNVVLLCNEYTNLFNTACELIRLYINDNGNFKFKYMDVIKDAFYTELIEDGETWIKALSMTKFYKAGNKKSIILILSYLRDEKFCIYEDLNKIFQKLTEEDE